MAQQLTAWWPAIRDRSWTLREALIAAATYRGALVAGFGEERAAACAEAAGYKELYDGLVYPDEIERDLAKVVAGSKSRAGTS